MVGTDDVACGRAEKKVLHRIDVNVTTTTRPSLKKRQIGK
jgi:hypothetical protein